MHALLVERATEQLSVHAELSSNHTSSSRTNSNSIRLDPASIRRGLSSSSSISRGSNSSSGSDPHSRYRGSCQLQHNVYSCPRFHLKSRGNDSSAVAASSSMASRVSRVGGVAAAAGQRAEAMPVAQG